MALPVGVHEPSGGRCLGQLERDVARQHASGGNPDRTGAGHRKTLIWNHDTAALPIDLDLHALPASLVASAEHLVVETLATTSSATIVDLDIDTSDQVIRDLVIPAQGLAMLHPR